MWIDEVLVSGMGIFAGGDICRKPNKKTELGHI